MSNKEINLKEKLKQALESTVRVISDDFNVNTKLNDKQRPENFDFFDFENLANKNNFIKARAETDSAALKKKIFRWKNF